MLVYGRMGISSKLDFESRLCWKSALVQDIVQRTKGPPEVLAIPARRIGCWILRRAVSCVVMGPEGAMIAEVCD